MTGQNQENSRLTRRQKKSSRHLILNVLKWLFLIALLVVVSGIGLFAYYAKDAPSISKDELQNGGSSSLYTTNGKFLLSLGSEKRTYVTSDEIPQKLKDAVISVEDRHFYSEGLGLDPIRIVGSVLINARSNGVVSGGSTITQQLVKLSVFSTATSQRTLRRKAQEAWLAMKVERDFSKNQILEFYINKVFMNYGNYGMGTAADFYYGKPLKSLDLAQTALLAGMPNAPVIYDPYVHPQKAKYRRDVVLKAMYKNDKITKSQYLNARRENIKTGLQPRKINTDSNLRKVDDAYIKEVISEVKAKGFDPYNDNLKITVNIDQAAQNKLYELANNGSVPFTDDKQQVGVSIVDPNNGNVIAILGGRKLPAVQLGLDRAVQTGRSTGSSVKPVLDYGPAIEYLNWSTHHILDDSRYVYPGTNVQLYDWDNTYLGKMTMRYAIEQSRNVPAVKTLSEVGVSRASLFARKLGVNVPADSGLSVAIGANASSLQMAGAFSAFATEGTYHKPQFVSKIETADGLVHNYNSAGKRVMKKSTAYMITDMLKGVITKGSGTTAKIDGLYQAGKTGTVKYSDEDLVKYPSYNSSPKDSWFVGYTKKYSIGVWTGYDNLKDGTLSGIGQQSAQLLYKQMMQYLMQNQKNSDWKKPSTVVRRRIVTNALTDEVARKGQSFTWELFVKGHEPKAADYDENDEEEDTNSDSDDTEQQSSSSDSSQENGSTSQSNQQSSQNSSNSSQSSQSSNQQSSSSQSQSSQSSSQSSSSSQQSTSTQSRN